ncbi:hypothetical protein ACH4VR_25395 [Streptomyces sp. NPDC020883]|uniref:hypothetical protein n=1 Tax=Streptomyces sp. NPDC020883 TaxID=3365099 RepID=UPI0037B9D439
MTIEQLAMLATFGSTWAVLAVGHNVADYVFGQSDHQAANKGAPTAEDGAAGFVWSAATHAVLARRWPVRWLLQRTGSPAFAELRTAGLNGMNLADQACTPGPCSSPRS